MGWFTSNLNGQPHLYPTRKDYEKEHLDPETQHQKRKQPHLYPLRHDYESKTVHETKQPTSEDQSEKKHQAKLILQKLKMKNEPLVELLSMIQGQELVCKIMGKQLQKCIRSIKIGHNDEEMRQICRNQLTPYQQCLKNALYEDNLPL